MLIYPEINPIALSLGPLLIRWYGLMYVAAFLQFFYLGRARLQKNPQLITQKWQEKSLDDLLFYGFFGVVLGGRLGEVFFYEPAYFFSNPLKIIAVWEGGLSFHGGFLGVLCAMFFFAYKNKRHFFEVTDFIAPLIPLGLMFGRIGNFINGELWGRVADVNLPWAMVFRHVDNLPRHPSQIYQALLEGLLLFILLWIYAKKPRTRGQISGAFLFGYGFFRFIAEFFRTPDAGIFGQSDVISMGQYLSMPMILGGVFLLMANRQNKV